MSHVLSTKSFLEELVRREPNTPERENDVSQFIAEEFKRIIGKKGKVWSQPVTGRYAEGMEKRYNVAFEIEPPEKKIRETLLLYAHFDVVEPAKSYKKYENVRQPNELWTDPDHPDVVYGLGSLDMLGGIAAIRQAIQHIVQDLDKESISKYRRIKALLVYGEEGDSAGFMAARDGGLFEGVDVCITPEILVNQKLLTKPRGVGHGRLGRYGFTIVTRGLSQHTGAMTDENCKQSTDELRMRAELLAKKEFAFQPHSQEECPRARCALRGDVTPRASSLTTPSETRAEFVVHYPNVHDNLSEVMARLRQSLGRIAREAFPDDSDPQEVWHREHAFEVLPEAHRYEFAKPYIDDPNDPFHQKVREWYRDAYVQFSNPDAQVSVDEVIQPIIDTGVADCGRIADLGIRVADVYPVGGKAHTEDEHLWLPSIDEIAYVIRRAAHTSQILGKKAY